MAKPTSFDKILAVVCVISCALWFGGSFARYALAYDMFIPGTAELRPLELETRLHIIRLCSNMLGYCLAAYSAMFCTALVLALRNRLAFRVRGYLFMAFVLLLLAFPAESFLAYQDWQIYTAYPDRFSIAITQPDILMQQFIRRFTQYSVIGFLSLLAHATALALMAWKPLSKET